VSQDLRGGKSLLRRSHGIEQGSPEPDLSLGEGDRRAHDFNRWPRAFTRFGIGGRGQEP
jgi:hypothetical protein